MVQRECKHSPANRNIINLFKRKNMRKLIEAINITLDGIAITRQ